MNQSINTDSKNSKEPQQKYRLGTVSIKILGGLNRFYRRLTSPSASIMAQNIQLFGPRIFPCVCAFPLLAENLNLKLVMDRPCFIHLCIMKTKTNGTHLTPIYSTKYMTPPAPRPLLPRLFIFDPLCTSPKRFPTPPPPPHHHLVINDSSLIVIEDHILYWHLC